MAHIVAVAHPRQLEPAEVDAALPEREEVCHGLARMLVIAESVDHRHGGMLGQLHQGAMSEDPRRDAVDPAGEVPRHVGDRLAFAHADLLRGEIDGGASELNHAHLERHPRAEGWLLEDEREGPAAEGCDPLARLHPGLELGGELEEPVDVILRQILDRQEVRHCLADSKALSMMAQPSPISFSVTMRAGASRSALSPAVRARRPRSRQAFTRSPTGGTMSMPTSRPRPRTSLIALGYFARRVSSPSRRSLPMRAARSASLSSSSVAKTVTPTAVASGLPPKVEPWLPGVKALATLSVARVAPMGTPLARALARVMMSGATPECS